MSSTETNYHLKSLSAESLGYLREKVKPRDKTEFLTQQATKGISPAVIEALELVDRGLFLQPDYPTEFIYAKATSLLQEQNGSAQSTVSQPEVVAQMTDLLQIKPGDHVLEIGTGAGYQASILSFLVGNEGRVTSVEVDEEVASFALNNMQKAQDELKLALLDRVTLVTGDGSAGYEENAPYDKIIVTASFPPVPVPDSPLFKQLIPGGRLVVPIGGFGEESTCHMLVIGKDAFSHPFMAVAVDPKDRYSFVEIQGEYGWRTFKQSILFAHAYYFMKALGWNVSTTEYVESLNE